jgi:hypothetical protein
MDPGSDFAGRGEAHFAQQKVLREKKPEGVASYEEGDPRLELSKLQFGALPYAVQGWSASEIAGMLRVSPERVKRFFLTPRFRRAMARERRKPSSPDLLRLGRRLGVGEASRRAALPDGRGTLTEGGENESAT